eukprot:comp15009_c0_seq1/m.11621 comp15009_c0_seq1/g.11621  ORF comp15009_c0_seq1/g.11621 comp15009_c0_seq1/m.11621 type:complete len:496 (-) comp15009_c0_seq1:114-1601(-)
MSGIRHGQWGSAMSLFSTNSDTDIADDEEVAVEVDAIELKKAPSRHVSTTDSLENFASGRILKENESDDDLNIGITVPTSFPQRATLAVRRILCAQASHEYHHTPLFPSLTRARALSKEQRTWVQWVYIAAVLLCLCLGLHYNNFAANTEYGSPVLLNCTATWSEHAGYIEWQASGSGGWLPVRCQSFCSIFSPNTTASVIGSSSSFTPRSPICKAAVESGYVSNTLGGCAAVRKLNSGDGYELAQCQQQAYCSYYNVVFFAAMFAVFGAFPLVSPTIEVYSGSICVAFFWYVVLISQPRYTAQFYQDSLATFLPYLVVCYIFYKTCVKRTMFETNAPKGHPFVVDVFLFYFVPCFLFLHMNFVKPFLNFSLTSNGDAAIQRLSGGRLIGCIIILKFILVALVYMLKINREVGRLPRILAVYSVITVCFVVVSLAVKDLGLSFHLHHYALGALLLPVTAIQTRFASFCQAALLGVFINGAAAYGFHSMWVLRMHH